MMISEIDKKNQYILVIDDEPGIRESISDNLLEEGYTVYCAATGKEALALSENRFFNIALIDINLPDINGLEVLKSIKQRSVDTYPIILTASTLIENSINALNQGAYAYLVKPFAFEELKETIKRAISEQKFVLENKRLFHELKQSNEALVKAKTEVDNLNKHLESLIDERTKQLREQMVWTETIINSLADGLCTVDKEWKITMFNQQAEIITGYNSSEVINRFHYDIFRSIRHDCTQLIQKVLQKGENVSNLEIYFTKKNGEMVPLLVSAAPIKDKNGIIIGAVQNFRDITEHKQLQEQLIQASKLASMGELLANFAHEIKNPLNGMTLFAALIRGDADPQSDIYNYAERILEEGDRIGKITSDILTFSHQDNPDFSYENIVPIIESTLSLTERQLNLDNITIEKEFSDHLPLLKINSSRIQQVLLNMINNAQYSLNKKFGNSNGRKNKRIKVCVSAVIRDEKNWISIVIEDNGIGMNQNIKGKIFEPFFTTKSVGQGTGLGLSVSYGIIKDHHGEIIVQTKEEKYTRFIIYLPAFEE